MKTERDVEYQVKYKMWVAARYAVGYIALTILAGLLYASIGTGLWPLWVYGMIGLGTGLMGPHIDAADEGFKDGYWKKINEPPGSLVTFLVICTFIWPLVWMIYFMMLFIIVFNYLTTEPIKPDSD